MDLLEIEKDKLGVEFFGVMVMVLVAGTTGSAMLTGITLGAMATLAMGISGAHLNPAITIGQMAMQKMKWEEGVQYLVAQIGGAIIGCWVIAELVVGGKVPDAATGAGDDIFRNLALMIISSVVVMVAWIHTIERGEGPNIGGMGYGLAFWLMLEVWSNAGGAMHAAQHFGYSIWSGFDWGTFYMYWLGPIIGVLLTIVAWDWFEGDSNSAEE